MASYYENKNFFDRLSSGSVAAPEREEDFYIDKNTTLKKDDLMKYQYVTPIRDYMVERKGVDYKNMTDEEVHAAVADFQS